MSVQPATALRKNNRSGYRGVSWYPRYKKWIAQVHISGKHINLGYYDDVHDAGIAACDYRLQHADDLVANEERRRAAIGAAMKALSPEQRRARMRHAESFMTPEQRKARARKSVETLGPKKLSERARRGRATQLANGSRERNAA